MRGNLIYILILIAALIAASFGYSYLGLESNIISNSPPCSDTTWFTTADYLTNAYHLWRVDPLICKITSLSETSSISFVAFACWLVFFAGCGTLFLKFQASRFNSFIIPLLLTGSLHLIFGTNIIIAGSLCWLPWYIYSLSKTRDSIIWHSISLVFLLLVFFSANQLTIFVFLIALFIHSQVLDKSELAISHKFGMLVASILSLSIPLAKTPNYPALSRVVEDDGIPGIIRPLIGPDSPIQIISQASTFEHYFIPVLFVSILSIIFIVKYLYKSDKTPFFILGVLILSLLIDFFGTSHLTSIGPIKSVSRLLPGLSAVALNVFTIAALVVSTIFVLSSNIRSSLILSILFFISSSANYLLSNHQNFPNSDLKLVSPSLSIYQKEGKSLLSDPNSYREFTRIPLRKNNAQIQYLLDNDQRKLRRILDISEATRWSTGLGEQTGNESLILNLHEPIKAKGIEINVGKFTTDFPRGLRIYNSDGPTKIIEGMTNNLIKDSDPWQGVIKFTSDGYPYYGSQSEVRTFFKSEQEIKYLLIKQTGTSNSFEWSVTSINLLQ